MHSVIKIALLNQCLFINKAVSFLLLLMVSIHTYDFLLVWKSFNQGYSICNKITAI